MERILRVLTGCTAVGKTEWALRWAEAFGAEIVSADSMLFYRGMDIGTAKPARAQRERVRHHLIDICDVGDPMDVARYTGLAHGAVSEMADRGVPAIVTGGSGFYLKSFFSAVADDVAVSPETRAAVREMSEAAVLERLKTLNPDGLGALDVANPRRVARALERCLASGRTLAVLEAEFASRPVPFQGWRVELTQLDCPSEALDRRIEERTDAMFRDGLVEEVRGLMAAGIAENPSAVKAIGYREVIAMLEGLLEPGNLKQEIVRNTRALVKKQRTWFRTQLPAHRVVMTPDAALETLFSRPEPRL